MDREPDIQLLGQCHPPGRHFGGRRSPDPDANPDADADPDANSNSNSISNSNSDTC
jgi:hypothetical protein